MIFFSIPSCEDKNDTLPTDMDNPAGKADADSFPDQITDDSDIYSDETSYSECSVTDYDGNTIIIRDINVITMENDKILRNFNVIIKNGVISEICSPLSLHESPALIIEGKNKYLMPGLSDMHVHYNFEEERILYLANGVTTIRNMWGDSWHIKIREETKKGETDGPELHTTSPIIDGDPPYWSQSTVITTPEDAEKYIKLFAEIGYEYIKVYNKLSSEVYDTIIEISKKIKIPVVGHVPYKVGIEKALRSGQFSIEHFEGYSKTEFNEVIDDLTVSSGTWNCPTLTVMDKYNNIDQLKKDGVKGLRYVNPALRQSWTQVSEYNFPLNHYTELFQRLHNKGAKFVAGTDAGNPFVVPGFSLHDELELIKKTGISEYETLLTATRNAAEMLGTLKKSGTITKEKDADIIILNSNPFEDINNSRDIFGVMVKGRWFSQEQLQKMLDELAEKYENENPMEALN